MHIFFVNFCKSFFILSLASEPTDFTIEKGPMMLIWAVGQSKGQYSHKPASGLERGTPSIEDFYRPDEVKYHGKDNRGFATINFYGKYLCNMESHAHLIYYLHFKFLDKPEEEKEMMSKNEFKFPTGCRGTDCKYNAS